MRLMFTAYLRAGGEGAHDAGVCCRVLTRASKRRLATGGRDTFLVLLRLLDWRLEWSGGAAGYCWWPDGDYANIRLVILLEGPPQTEPWHGTLLLTD